MYANRFTALVDACSLAGNLKRDLLLSLAAGEFYRLRWSKRILDETEAAVTEILRQKGAPDAVTRAAYTRAKMELAFEEAMVTDFTQLEGAVQGLADPSDGHVVAAALKTRAHVIVTDNKKDFPEPVLEPLGLVAVTTDEFLANTIDLSEGAAVEAIRQMREEYQRPEMDAGALLLRMEAVGLPLTASLLREFAGSL